MVALAVLSYLDGWGITDSPATFQVRNLYQTLFFGQGAALNVLLAQLWSTVLGRSHRPLRFSLGPFLVVVLFDTASTICLAFRFGGFFIASTVMPGCLLLLEIVTSLRLLYLSRTLLITLRDAAGGEMARYDRDVDRMHSLHINIAYSAAVSAIGSLLTCTCLAAYSLGFAWDSPSQLIAVGLTGYVARCSTAAAQIRFCWPAGSRPSRSAVTPHVKPGTVSGAATLKSSHILT